MVKRLLLNLFSAWFVLWRSFPAPTMRRIRDLISAGERHHEGELCFAVEARFTPWAVLSGLHSRARAEQVFSRLRVWDTATRSGVLLYLQLAERRIEILADQGISARVPAVRWQMMCERFAHDMQAIGPAEAVIACLNEINALLQVHFPAAADNPRELPDDPVVL